MGILQSSLLGYLLTLLNFYLARSKKQKLTINCVLMQPQPQVTFVVAFCHHFSMLAMLEWAQLFFCDYKLLLGCYATFVS